MRVNIELDLDDVVAVRPYGEDGEREVTLREAIVAAAARRVMDEIDGDARREIRDRATKITDAAIRDEVEPLVRGAIQSTIVARLGAKETSLEEHIVAIVREELKGRSDTRSGYRDRESILVRLLREEVDRVVAGELREAIKESKLQVKAAVREKGAEILAETIERMGTR